MGVGENAQDSKKIQGAVTDLTLIAGQKPMVTKSRKAIARVQAARKPADRLQSHAPRPAHVSNSSIA